MGFFNPGLIWFALGGTIPIIIHLLHRQKFKRIRWAAMEFLLAALRKTQRRLRIENLILLLLRILIMVLLAFAVARPFFREAPLEALGDTDAHHVFVVDVSYSMAYKKAQKSSLDAAKDAAEKVLNEIRSGEQDKFTLVAMSTYPDTTWKERNRKDQIRAAIHELKPSDYGTSVYATLLEVKSLLDGTRNRDKRVYIFTDMQRGGWEFREDADARKFAELLKNLSHRENTRFYLIDAGAHDAFNRALVDLRVETQVVTTRRPTRFTALVHNFSTTPLPNLGVSLYVDDNLYKSEQTVLPANTSTPVTFEYTFAESGPHVVKVSIEPDYLDVDDHRWLALDVRSALRGLVVDGEPKDSPTRSETFFYVTALDPDGAGSYFSIHSKNLELFSGEGLDGYDFLLLANVQSLTGDKVEKIEQFVRRGGGLLLTLGPRVDKVSFNEAFWNGGKGLSPAMLDEVAGTAPEGQLEPGVERRINKFNPDHPIFVTFKDKLKAAVYGLVFWKYFRVKDFAPEHVFATFDDNFGSPAFLEKPFGDGKVILFTSAIDDEWNFDWPGKPPFLPMMYNASRYLATRPASQRNLFVGDPIQIELPVEFYQPPFTLETPQDGVLTLTPNAPRPEEKVFRLIYPGGTKTHDPKAMVNEGVRHSGTYRVLRSAQKEEEKRLAIFAVNLPPRTPSPEEVHAAEGNMDRISKDEIHQRFPEFKVEFRGERKEGEQEIDLAPPPDSNVWKYLLYLVLGFLLIESVLACLFGRGKQ